MKGFLIGAGIIASFIGVGVLIGRACSSYYHNKIVNSEGQQTVSFSTGVGHVEYTQYASGMQEVRKFPGLRWLDIESFLDVEGDGLVDSIRINSNSNKAIQEVLVRQYDLQNKREKFEEADKFLQALMEKYKAK